MVSRFIIILKGLWVGATMTVPGVSGGTMAVIVGIYEDLIHAVNELKSNPKGAIPFLLEFLIGAGAGFLLLAKLVTSLLEQDQTGGVVRFFFCGVVAGGIPLLVRKAKISNIKMHDLLYLFLGAGIVLALMQIPPGVFMAEEGAKGVFLQLVGGFLIAVALILPGISATHMLYMLGLYELVLKKMYACEILALLPMAIGGIAGTFLTTNAIETLMKKHTAMVYFVIIGFVAGSLTGLIPAEGFRQPTLELAVFLPGFAGMIFLTRKV